MSEDFGPGPLIGRDENERLLYRWVLSMDDEQRDLVMRVMSETDPERHAQLELEFVRTLTEEQGAMLALITRHSFN
jgi:hypothetical protein